MLKETYSSGSYTESTIADGGLSWPTEIAVDGNGNVYFADYFNSRVLKETYSSGSYTQSVIPTGSPLVYHLDADLKPTVAGGTYLDPEAAAAGAAAVASQGAK